MTTEQIKTTITAASEPEQEQNQPDHPEPLRKPMNQPAEFPVDALPKLLRGATLALHSKIQAPLAICAQSILAVSNLAAQAHADVMLPIIGQTRPISCFFLTIAESGERKSSCDNEALSAVKAHEAKLKEGHDAAIEGWQNIAEAYESQRQSILKDRKKYPDLPTKKAALDKLGQKPVAPLTPMLICPEPTFEGLCRLMQNSHPSLGIFSAEGGQFIGGHGMKDENKIRTATALSSSWDGEAIKRVRAGEAPLILAGRRLSMHLMAQPGIAASFLSDPELKSQGLLSRVLVVSPLSAIGTRFSNNKEDDIGQTHQKQALEAFKRQITEILSLPTKTKADNANELKPRLMTLSIEAEELYISYADRVERMMAQNEPFESIRGFASKLPEHAVRIAATVALAEDIEVGTISYRNMEGGIAIAEFYASEAVRLFDEGAIDPKIVLAERLLHWLHNNWGKENVSLPDIYQNSLNAIATKAKAAEVVRVLEGHGWLVRNEGAVEIRGRVRRESWRVIL